MDFDRLLELFASLHRNEVEYILVGGVAVNFHGIQRMTEDVDLFLKADEANVCRLKKALHDVFDDVSIDEITAQDLSGDYPTIRYFPPDDSLIIDLICRLGEAVKFTDLDFETILVESVPVRVAAPRTLIFMKKDTIRPKDRADADHLRRKFNLD